MNFEQRYKELNKNQKKAVDTIEGPLLVVAGPGSGKTEILSLRVGKILKETQVLPSNILCLTFTESATVNMRNRLAGLIGSEAYRVSIHTFHNFCVEIIQKYPEYFYNGAFYSPADELTQIQILQEIFENLPVKNPLKVLHPEEGFVYLRDTLRIIGNLKKAGIEPDEFDKILKHNEDLLPEINKIIQQTFEEKINKDIFIKIEKALSEFSDIADESARNFPSLYFHNIALSIYTSLKKSYDEAIEVDKTTPITAWKTKWIKKNDEGENIFKDYVNMEKLYAVSSIYYQYRKIMHEKSLYDFDDMILDCLRVLKDNSSLKFEIQEQYQYVLVDEFQDTNEAQMRILRIIADAQVNEGRPNIMAVGDDDQAVYKFQGAELSNILNFKNTFKDVQIVTMTENYRSTQDILDIASHIIRKGEERLEKLLPEIEKELVASNTKISKGVIKRKEFQTIAHEYHYISREIRKLIDEGQKPEEIAVIARKHSQLEKIVPYFQSVKIPIRYEREQNVFKEPHIAQLILISRFLVSLSDKNKDEADEYLPKILSFPFWKIDREIIWKISLAARRGDPTKKDCFGKTWLEVMLESEKEIISIAKFLIKLGVESQSLPLEQVLDEIVGAHLPVLQEDEDGEDAENHGLEVNKHTKNSIDFTSPFKEYYFSKDRFEHSKAEYLSFLSSLRVFVNALREYKSGEILTLKDLVEFVDLHEKNDISLNDQSPFAKLSGAVNLLTAHKAKGLEFETVFVLSCQDNVWAGKKIPSKISFPANLQIEPAGDTEDDQLRLFYVAITRAKRFLYLTSYQIKEDGKDSQKLRFLITQNDEEEILKNEALKNIYLGESFDPYETTPETHEVLTASWLNYHTPPFIGPEKDLLKTLLNDYKMPVTHLNNFLNIKKGGPQFFLEQNLLRFPQAKTVSGSYGSAIHSTLEKITLEIKKGNKPTLEEILNWFNNFLRRERLSQKDFNEYNERGVEALTIFWKNKKDSFNKEDISEFNFKDQGVVVGEAQLSGKIDKIINTDRNIIEVHDYKTGKPVEEWSGKDDYEKTKLYEYEKQLLFYKILVENSREFGNKKEVDRGVLEFVEPKKSNGQIIDLELRLDKEKTDKLKKLIEIIYKKIINLDFPNTNDYSQDLKGIQQFENDLIEGKI
ncbi:MAG: ATP-dependent DNA helicase [Candidatus Pacebacteria bacterium]|nr:ATP-dependent DNA helicase [Candidatus Paceibacterota bacterium]